jgi:beta-glucosidase
VIFKRLFLALALLSAAAAPGLASPDIPPAPVGRQPFLWGVAVSGLQNDGATPQMDWYQVEKRPHVEKSGLGPDFRHHMDADLDRAQSLGINAFRFSIEWARLEPSPGHFDLAEVAYVHRLLNGLKKRGMTPIVTLHHFVTPEWICQDSGDGLLGWENPRTVQEYLRYVSFVVKEFGSDIKIYLTINEPSTLVGGGYFLGWMSPFHSGPISLIEAARNIVEAHVGAYQLIHAANPDAMVSMPDYNGYLSVATGISYMPTEILSLLLDHGRGWDGLSRVKYLDFIALQYYGSLDFKALSSFPTAPYLWGARPDDMYEMLKGYYETLHLPILVAENGFATENGTPRPDGWTRPSYLVAHIQALEKARQEGVPIMGYLYWTLTDNYEWGSYTPRFGLWSVDVRSGNLTRHETPSVAVYRAIVKHDGVTPELAAHFPPPASYLAAHEAAKPLEIQP